MIKLRAVFRDLIARSNSSGVQAICRGSFPVYIERIPPNAPQDWSMGPPQTPGLYGAYREHLFYDSGHGPYAFATGATVELAKEQAGNWFKSIKKDWTETRTLERAA
jgi:hypothetical protein